MWRVSYISRLVKMFFHRIFCDHDKCVSDFLDMATKTKFATTPGSIIWIPDCITMDEAYKLLGLTQTTQTKN